MTQCWGRYSDFPALSVLVRYRPASIFFHSSFRPLRFPCFESLCFGAHLASQFGLLSPSLFVSAYVRMPRSHVLPTFSWPPYGGLSDRSFPSTFLIFLGCANSLCIYLLPVIEQLLDAVLVCTEGGVKS